MTVKEFKNLKIFKNCDDYSFTVNDENIEYEPTYIGELFDDLIVIGTEHCPGNYIIINVEIPEFTTIADFLYG